jgi:hypothetical protein
MDQVGNFIKVLLTLFCYLQLFFTYSSFVKVNLQKSYKIDKIDSRRCIGQNKDQLAGAERAKHQK